MNPDLILRLQAAMKLRHCTQAELADVIQMDRANFSRLFNQKPRAPELSAEHILLVCRHLKISSDWLLGLAEHELILERHEWFRAYKRLPKGLQVALVQAPVLAVSEFMEDEQLRMEKALKAATHESTAKKARAAAALAAQE